MTGGGTRRFLDELADEHRTALLALGRRRHFDNGAHLLRAGDRSGMVVVIQSGYAKVVATTAEGGAALLSAVGPGELLGELAAVTGEPHSVDVVALEDLEAVAIPAGDFVTFLEVTPGATLTLLRTVMRRLRDADARAIEFTTLDVVGRLANRLVHLADEHGQAGEGGVEITLRLSQEELAAWTGATRETVSRALQMLRLSGWIEVGRRRITVVNRAALARRAK